MYRVAKRLVAYTISRFKSIAAGWRSLYDRLMALYFLETKKFCGYMLDLESITRDHCFACKGGQSMMQIT
ncbi:hypothetical protein BDN67DRAFT_971713, partial [Paxillus ammoniavirescens]